MTDLHPDSFYFGVGRIGADQLEDYATRAGLTAAEATSWLGSNLAQEASATTTTTTTPNATDTTPNATETGSVTAGPPTSSTNTATTPATPTTKAKSPDD